VTPRDLTAKITFNFWLILRPDENRVGWHRRGNPERYQPNHQRPEHSGKGFRPFFVACSLFVEETVVMSPALRRFLLIALIALIQFQILSYGKPPKKNETEGLVYATFPGQPNPSKPLLELLVRQARWDNGDIGNGNEQRLKLQFDKVDDPAAPKGAVPRYRVFAIGAPENKVYAWRVWRSGEEPKAEPGDLYVNGRGLLMTRRPLPAEEYSLRAPGAEFTIAPEADSAIPIRYDISSLDDQLALAGTLVPQPVAAEDHGCRLEVRVAQPNAAVVLFVADGFPSESKIPLVLESEGQTLNMTMITDSAGHAIVAGFPSVAGKAQGNLKATAEGPDCLPLVTLPWGAAVHSTQKAP
jgi:hypothetical protein